MDFIRRNLVPPLKRRANRDWGGCLGRFFTAEGQGRAPLAYDFSEV
jgi:hypothetical protein